MKIEADRSSDRRPQNGDDGPTLKSIRMSTERKDAKQTATETGERYQTGKCARDEQTESTIGGTNEFKDNWEETRKAPRKDHGQLAEADLELKPGQQEIIDPVGSRSNKSPEEARRLVQDTARRYQKSAPDATSRTGTYTQATHNGHKEAPEASERNAHQDTPKDQHQNKPRA